MSSEKRYEAIKAIADMKNSGPGTAAPANVAATASLPTPVARWTFDGENPLADTTGNAALTLSEASTNDTFNVTYVSGDAICGKAAKFAPKSGSGFLKWHVP